MPPKPAPRRSVVSNEGSPGGDRVPVPKPRPRTRQIRLEETTVQDLPVKLFVSSLPRSCSEDLLINYFESKKNFGRFLDVTEVEYDAKRNQAVVTFQNNEDLQTVLDKHEHSPCNLSKTEIHVEVYVEKQTGSPVMSEEEISLDESQTIHESDDEIESETSTIIVKGYDLNKSTESLQYYFENRARSGGGEVISLQADTEMGCILIHFEDKKVVKSVLEKCQHQPHVVEGCRLSIRPFIFSKTDVLFTNIPETVSEENLKNFLEARLRTEVSQGPVAYNSARDRGVVKFCENVDIRNVERVCRERPIEGAYLTPAPVSITNTILVTNLPEKATRDSCYYYFENRNRSGGGEIEDIDCQLDEGYCLISFFDRAVLDTVCQKDHNFMGANLKVTPYHTCLGKPTSPEARKPWVLPEPIHTNRQHEHKLKFIKSKDIEREQADRTFQDFHAQVYWEEKPVMIVCCLTDHVKGYRKLGNTWTADVMAELTRMMEDLIEQRFTANDEAFPLVRKELQSVNLLYPDEVAVYVEKKENTVILIATRKGYGDAESKIQEKFDKVSKELARQKEKISKTKNFDEWKMKYIQLKEFREELEQDYPNVVFQMDMKRCVIEFTGPQTEVNDIIMAFYDKFDRVRQKKVKLPAEAITLLENPETQQQISNQIKRKRYLDLWEFNTDSVTVFIDDGEDFSQKKMIFKGFYTMMEFDIDAGAEILQRQDKWRELEQTLYRRFPGCIVLNKIGSTIKLCTRNDVKSNIQEQFQQFVSKNSISSEEVRVEKYVLQFVRKYMDRELTDGLKGIQRNTEVKVEYRHTQVLIRGTSEGLSNARRLLEKLTGRVKFRQHPMKRPGIKQYMTSTKGQESVRSVETNTPCIIHISDSSDAQPKVADQSKTLQMLGLTQSCAEALLPTGQRVIVYGGNMLQLQVDVIVNAGNEEMKHTGGLAAAIIKSGGKSIQLECSESVRKYGSVAVGEVIVSGAGNLSCRYIVHAVGPRWQGGGKNEPQLLQKAIENCLQETNQRQCTSIALPALCTGVYKYPVDKACALIITTVYQFFQTQRSSTIRDIYLCDINPKTVNSFMKALSSIVGIQQVQASGDQTSSPPQQRAKPGGSPDKGQACTSIVFGSTQVKVIKGNITSEKVDAIVNSASNDLDLKKGKASSAMLKAGGNSIQDECKKNYPNGISVGEVAVTTGGKLKCKNILHICLDVFSHKNSVENLQTCVGNCLQEAEKLGSQSVAFPALGTGAQHFPPNIVAEKMFQVVAKYCRNNQDKTTIKEVNFVIFHMDTKIYETFIGTIGQFADKGNQNQGSQIQGSQNQGNQDQGSQNQGTLNPPATDSTDPMSNPGSSLPSAPVTAPSQIDQSKVEKKVIQISTDGAEFQIADVKVIVIQGDITEQDTKAIVASSNVDLDLVNTGQVTKALLAKGGPEIEKDCEQNRPLMKSTGLVVTTGGQLKCEKIMFVNAPNDIKQWEHVVLQCLQTAEGQGISSIAFPALGTVMGHDPGRLASLIYVAICSFVAGRGQSKVVQEIRLVIFQKTMMDPIINGIKSSIQGQSILSQLGQALKGFAKAYTQPKDSKDVTVSDGAQTTDNSHQTDNSTDTCDTGDACTLTVYAESNSKIDDALRRLEKMVTDEWFTQKIDDPSVLKLDTKQIANIEAEAKKNNIIVKIDQDVGGIEVQGLIGNIMPVKDLIYQELRAFERNVHEKKHAELLTNVVKWFWIDKSSNSKQFKDVDNLKIENAYKNKEAKVTLTDDTQNEDFEIDFQQMLTYYVENSKEKYAVIRRDLIADTGVDIPIDWDSMGQDENLRMVKLPDTSDEYKKVLAEFASSLGRTPNIIQIDRIQNKTLYTQYAAKRRLMETNNPNMKNEHILWHGTDVNAVANITAHGYNRSYCGKNATKFGEGVYFAVNSNYSDRNGYARPEPGTKHKRMYRALVLVGHYAQGVEGMRVPPVRTKGNPDTLYDSVTNNMSDPAMFVIFHDTQAYPEHIITYT